MLAAHKNFLTEFFLKIEKRFLFSEIETGQLYFEFNQLYHKIISLSNDFNFVVEDLFTVYIIIERLHQLLLFEDSIRDTVDNITNSNKESFKLDNNFVEHKINNEDLKLNQTIASDTNKYLKCKRANYSKEVSKILKNWLKDNLNNPYPSEAEKNELKKITGLDCTQINNWFINARRRILPYMKSKYVKYDE